MARSRNDVIVETLSDMAFGGRDGCGCQGCVAMVFLVLVAITWVGSHRHQLVKAGVVGVGIVSAIVLARETLRRTSWPKKRATKFSVVEGPVPLAKIEPGVVHTAGLIGIDKTPIPVPLEGAPCGFFRLTVSADGATLFETQSAEALVLEDGAGAKLTVKLQNAKWKLDHVFETASPNRALEKFLAERGIVAAGTAYARVEWIAPHELVFVRGRVEKIGEDVAGYRESEHASLVMTDATIAMSEAPKA